MSDLLKLSRDDQPVYVDPAKIDAIYFFDPYEPSNGTCIAVAGVVCRVDEHVEAVHAARLAALQPKPDGE